MIDKEHGMPGPDAGNAKADLDVSEGRYRRLFEQAKDGILIIDAETGKVLDVNSSLVDALGYPRHEILDKAVWELGFLKSVFDDKNKLEEIRKKEYVRYEYLPLETAGGKKIDVELAGNVYNAEKQKLIQLNLRIIGESKQLELELKASEERFRHLIENAPIGIALSREGKTIYANSKFLKMFGFQNPAELYGTPFTDQIAPEDRERVLQLTMKQEETPTAVAEYDIQGFRKDGSQFPFQTFVNQINLSDGPALIGYFTDVTKRKQAEAENQLLRDKAEISSRLAAIGEMAAGIAHEINNPLTAVIGFSELLMERKDLPEDVTGELKIINDGSVRVKTIVKHMLAFARQTLPVKASGSINELLDATLDLRAYVLRTSNINVIKNFETELPWISIDQGQMQQVFLNIIINAEQEMKTAKGRGTLTITTSKAGDQIHISFKDDGRGMSQAILGKLFNPFFTTKGVGEGTGLGLSLSRSIVLEHGGSLEVESEVGKGTTFIITLPMTPSLNEPEPSKPAVNIRTSPENFKRARILVVEDEADIKNLVRKILTKSGHTVETTLDSTEALSRIESTNYDVILLDVRMPGMSGIELYNLVKKKHPVLTGKIIFMSGDVSDKNTLSFFEMNNLNFIAKPFEAEALIRKVNTIL